MQYYYYAFFCPKNQTPKECEHFFFGPKIKLLKSLRAFFFFAPKNQTPKKFEGYDGSDHCRKNLLQTWDVYFFCKLAFRMNHQSLWTSNLCKNGMGSAKNKIIAMPPILQKRKLIWRKNCNFLHLFVKIVKVANFSDI